ncbi:intermembrane lipid transfer protein VPS13B-like [Arctopsyche grandis]|uniref:intermembrane lipid transfer protein VPS13B-like n=1 Tax=Arctopsyche grandis TaxID=121162 RepID=UPI00406D9FD1
MFRKIQSYVTPILLSYVEKYIKDFKTEDTQVSLWGGSVSLHNLELRPDIIQQELNLPFTLSSGHIHELLIQVPWMKIVSEPIVVTINTIECVLKLIDGKQPQVTVTVPPKNSEKLDAPPGYVQSLVNRIVSNIAFRCHNIILKYVEEDIVVSINIKQFHLDNVDGNWVPTFAEITLDDLHTRKLISLSDITLCLDKRNAAGKIETYLEPLLYKCELELRLDSTYLGVSNKRPLNTRISIRSPKLEFGFSYQQIPMILRITQLFLALKQKKLGIYEGSESSSDNVRHTSPKSSKSLRHDGSADSSEMNYDETWSGWMWSFVQPFPLGYGEEQDSSLNTNPIILFSINFDEVAFSFKVPDIAQDITGIYNNQRKFRYINVCSLKLKYVLCETSSHGFERFCFRGGVQHIVFYPENICACGANDIDSIQDFNNQVYYKSIENKKEEESSWPIEYDSQCIVESLKEEEMLAVCPAFAFTYVYHLTIPDVSKGNMNAIGTDLEYSNFREDITMNAVFGPFDAFICAGMIHRLSLIKLAADAYDYAPYYVRKPPIKSFELPPPTTDDYDALSEYVPKSNIKVTAVKPKFHIAIWDHCSSIKNPPFCESSSGTPLINRRKVSVTAAESNLSYCEKLKNIGSILIEIETLTGSISNPMYPNRLTYVTCQLPDPPAIMLDTCYKYNNLNFTNMQCFLVHKAKKDKIKTSSLRSLDMSCDDEDFRSSYDVNIPFITQCSFHLSAKHLLLKEYWLKNDLILHDDYNFNMENITVCGTLAKMLAAYHILMSALPQTDVSKMNEKSNVTYSKSQMMLMNTSILNDAFGDSEMVHLDINFEGLSTRSVFLSETQTHRMVLNAVKVFAIGSSKGSPDVSNVKQVWIVSAPESNSSLSTPLIKAVTQFSSSEQYLTFVTVKVEECSLVMDPLLCQWLTYSYHQIDEKSQMSSTPVTDSGQNLLQKRHSRRSLDEIVNRIGGSSRTLNRISLGQSSSDREKDYIHGAPNSTPQSNNNSKDVLQSMHKKEEPKQESYFFDGFIKKYFEHKNVAIYFELEIVTVYFPIEAVSALDFHLVGDAIKESVSKNYDGEKRENVLILRLPSVLLKSSSLKQNLLPFCIYGLPVKLPGEAWDHTKISYPWTVAMKDFSCSTLSCCRMIVNDVAENKIKETYILKPFSSDLTISFTPKMGKKKNECQREKFVSKENAASCKESSVLVNTPKVGENQDTTNLEKNINIKSNTKFKLNLASSDLSNTDTDVVLGCLTSIGICIHVDTEFVSVSLNQIQMILLNSIIHSNLELLGILMNIHARKKYSENVEDTAYNIHLVQDVNNYGRKQRNISNSDNIVDNLQEEDFSKDSDLVDSSCDIADVNKIDNRVEDIANLANQDARKNTSTISAWIQWTVSRISMKAYASSGGDDGKELKLVFAADDIVSSLDLQPEYLKWNMKVVTASIHHYKRCSFSDPWELGNFCGIILKGRELIKIPKSSGDNCFLFVNVTRARCSSVHNKWGDMCKSKPKLHVSDNLFISEIEISLQALDIILNLQSLEPFMFLLSLLSNSSVKCHMTSMENNTFPNSIRERNVSRSIAKSWDSQKLALCYFEGYHTRIIMPVVSLGDNANTENALILQIDQISLLPVADNPVCRSPLRPDLYQQAARIGFLNIPGSELEDRQCQFTLKGIGLYTTQWQQIENSYALDIQSQPTVSENPALQWNSTLSKQSSSPYTVNILEKVDVCMVLALSIFHHSELVCGPTIDVSIVSDIEIYLSIPQFKLVQTLTDEFSIVIKKIKEKMSISEAESDPNSNELERFGVSVCSYYKYINNTVFIKHFRESNFNIERNTPTSVDTGIVSDMMSNFTGTSKGSPKYAVKSSNSSKSAIDRLSPSADYFDVFITFGKISLNIFEIFTSDVNFPSVIENTDSKDDKGERTVQNFHSKPLLYAVVHQPNFSFSNHHFVTKSQFSIFHVSLSLGDDCLREGLPKSNDFLIALFETKSGTSDPLSGISPAFLTVKREKCVGKKDFIKIDIKCPIRITSSLDRILKLNKIKKLLLGSPYSKVKTESTSTTSENIQSYLEALKKFLMSYSSIDLTMSQVVFAMIVQDQIDFELLLSFSSYKHSIALNVRPEKITNLGLIDSLAVSLRKTDDRQTKILINPWTIGFDVNIIWEMWQHMGKSSKSPLIRIFVQTDRLLIDLSPEHIKILLGVFNYWNCNYALMESSNRTANSNTANKSKENIYAIGLPCLWNQVTAYDQHYKDDLRAGAFKFIHGGIGYPLPYQVFIGLNGLVWRYPQPRAITRVHSFPVPFQITNESEKKISLNESVVCTLEYYCDITNGFHYYAKFYIKQDDRVKLDYSKFDHCTVLSSMWRVVMHLNDSDIAQKRIQKRVVHFNKESYCSFDSIKPVLSDLEAKELSFPVRPQALAACLRIDSYFTPNLVPKFQMAVDISSAELNLYNNYRQRSLPPLIDSLKLFKSDGCLPTPHIFCSLALISTHLQSNIWNSDTAMFKFDSDISCDVINDGDMLLDRIVDCTDTSINFWKGEGYDDAAGSLIHARQLNIRGGPQHAHMLYVSYKLWQDILSSSIPPSIDDAVIKEKQICDDCANMKADMMITKYLICNDTNMSLKFGQIETEENIILESRKCHLYSWRMPNKKNLLRLTVNLGNWKLSEGAFCFFFQPVKATCVLFYLVWQSLFITILP